MFWDSPQKTHFLVWVDLSWFPSQTASSFQQCSAECSREQTRGPAAPGGLLPTHIFLFHFFGTMQDCTGFCPVPPQSFPSRRNLVDLISACTVCRREISLDVSAVWADHLFLCFSFDEILSHGNSSILPCHFFKEPLLSCCIKDSMKIHTVGIEDPFSLFVLKSFFWVSGYGWQMLSFERKRFTQTPKQIIFIDTFSNICFFWSSFQLPCPENKLSDMQFPWVLFKNWCQICYTLLPWCQGWYKW